MCSQFLPHSHAYCGSLWIGFTSSPSWCWSWPRDTLLPINGVEVIVHKVRAQALRNTTCSSPFLSFCNTHGETMPWPITGAGMKDRYRKPTPIDSWKLSDSHLICSPTTKIKLITVVFCCWDFESVHYKHSAAGVWLIYSVELRIMWIFLVLDIVNLTVASAPSAA